MSQFRSLAFCSAAMMALIVGPAFGRVQLEQDSRHQTIGIRGLDVVEGCGFTSFIGRIAKRVFADDAMTIGGFVVENNDGTRYFVNVFVPEVQDRFTQTAVLNGFQRLLKEGRLATRVVSVCGSGPVFTLEQIR